MNKVDISQFLLKPEEAPEVARFIAELLLPYLEADPELLKRQDALTALADALSIAWNISRLERRAEGAGLARRHYAELVDGKPALKRVLDGMLDQARAIDWYACAEIKVLIEGDTLIISAVQRNSILSGPPAAGQIAH